MKSYIQGLITGGVLVFAMFVLMGANDKNSEIGRYQLSMSGADETAFLVDTKSGTLYKWTRKWVEKKAVIGWELWGNGLERNK